MLGIGNVLMGDDGAGVRAVEYFKAWFTPPPGVECLDGGTAGLGLLSTIEGRKTLIIVDAVTSGGPPGTVVVFPLCRMKEAPVRASAHGIGVAELLAAAKFKGWKPSVTLVGIAPESISAGLALSPAVEEALPKAAEEIRAGLEKAGIRVARKKAPCTR